MTCAESIVCEYLPLSEKNASSAVTRLRRSEIIAVLYALLFVFANFGIAIAAKMPMITTTMSNSIRVKPLRRFSIMWGVGESRRMCMAGGSGAIEGNAHADFCRRRSRMSHNGLRLPTASMPLARPVRCARMPAACA